VEPRVKGTSYYPYFLAITGAPPSEVAKQLEDEDLRKLFEEKEAFGMYSQKDYEGALKRINLVGKEDFNYPSARMLEAFIHEDKGDKGQALNIYNELIKDYPNSYFARIARSRLLILERD